MVAIICIAIIVIVVLLLLLACRAGNQGRQYDRNSSEEIKCEDEKKTPSFFDVLDNFDGENVKTTSITQGKSGQIVKDGRPISKENHVVKCPACGSTNVKKISGARKVVLTELWGLASSDIGKQMECENCGYKF